MATAVLSSPVSTIQVPCKLVLDCQFDEDLFSSCINFTENLPQTPSTASSFARAAGKRTRQNEFVEAQRQVFFVGVCGPTGSGKSTLAEALAQEVASPIHPIGADMFFKFPGSSDFGSCPQRRFHNCWEHPDSVDHALLLKRLKRIKQQFATATITPEIVLKGPRGERKLNVKKGIDIDKQLGKDPVVILVEGFLLFADKNLTTFLDYHLFLDLKRETGSPPQLDQSWF